VKREVATFGVLSALLVLVVGAVPPFRAAVVDTVRAAWDARFPGDWSGYYVVYDDPESDLSSDDPAQLFFASGSFPGRAVRVLSNGASVGGWSADGERFVVGSGNRLYLGDRHGSVSLLADLREFRPTWGPAWIADREVVVSVTTGGTTTWLLRLDARTAQLVDQRGLPDGFFSSVPSPASDWVLTFDGTTGPPTRVLYDPLERRTVRPAAHETFQGWLPDGRVLVVTGDWPGPSELVARPVAAAGGEALLTSRGWLARTSSNGRHLAVTEVIDPERQTWSVWLITQGTAPARVIEGAGSDIGARPSGDGRFISFSELSTRDEALRARAGVIEVATGRVNYACGSGCAGLALR